jgi:hypothetical protein
MKLKEILALSFCYLDFGTYPLSVNEEWFLSFGAAIGYWQGDVNKLLDDMGALKPALFIGVPRVFDRIYGRVMGMVRVLLKGRTSATVPRYHFRQLYPQINNLHF